MKILKTRSLRVVLLMLALFALVLAGCVQKDVKVNEVPAEKEYTYINPDETKAETDAGIVIDGVLDEEAYKNNNWLYLHNEDGGNKVDIAMTSYFGEKGMYFVYDVTESVPIYVNLDRASYMNSCIEMYLAHPRMPSAQDNGFFEIDLLPTGDMIFKKANGKYRYFWLYRVKFGIPATNLTTKGESIEFSTPTIEGTVLRRNKPDANGNHPWKAEVNEDETGAQIISEWYNEVYEPSYEEV